MKKLNFKETKNVNGGFWGAIIPFIAGLALIVKPSPASKDPNEQVKQPSSY
jgi:hypothetical protein